MDLLQSELRELEAKMHEAAMKNRGLKEKIKTCADKASDEAFDLGLHGATFPTI